MKKKKKPKKTLSLALGIVLGLLNNTTKQIRVHAPGAVAVWTFYVWDLTTSVLIFWSFFTIPILQRTYPYVQHWGKLWKKQHSIIILRQKQKTTKKQLKLYWRTSYLASYWHDFLPRAPATLFILSTCGSHILFAALTREMDQEPRLGKKIKEMK